MNGDGGTGGIGEGPQFTVANSPNQTLVQSNPLLATTAKVDIAQLVNTYNYAGPSNVNAGQIVQPSNTKDEVFSYCQNYCNQMLRQGRGFPLYIPGPSRLLPDEYQVNGVQIGDVGTVTPEGLFDFLFNVYLPADHPININGVPEGFLPLPRYNDQTDIIVIDHGPGDYVSTSSVHKSAQLTRFPGGDFSFKCQPPAGAVLALPYGGMLVRLKNIQGVRDYARKHAESWYSYMVSTRGLAVDNGSLYLITGCEKAVSWGLGSYHSLQDDQFQASFKPIQLDDANPEYQWMGSGWLPGQHKQYNRPPPPNDLLNQTVFLHGFSISMRERSSGRLFITTTVDGDVTDIVQSRLETPTRGNSGVQSQSSSSFSWLFGFLSGPAHNGSHETRGENVTLSDISHIPNVCGI
ncbi:hypothetical protein C8R45DRAFT_916431 [Mycena sanguinolenta]|nr:hypothetical protein C8R45DRAFT_916431 [Mycena sanguinolenta]